MQIRYALFFVCVALVACTCFSCASKSQDNTYAPISYGLFQSAPKEISPDWGPYDIIQKAQEYNDLGNLTAAEYLYTHLLNEYGSDTTYRIIGQYEIAHIRIKSKRYNDAIPLLKDVIACFDYESEYESFPRKYYVLATNDLQRAYEATGYSTETFE